MNPAQRFTATVLETVAKALETDSMETLAADLEALEVEFHDAVAVRAMPRDPGQRVVKADQDQRMVWGWAIISTENGEPVVDRQGDIVETDTVQKAAHGFVSQYREGKVRHKGKVVGEVVDSLVFTDDIQKALGIDLGLEGWFVGMRIDDDETLAQVDAGQLPMFSIGGTGDRVAVQ